MITHDHHGGRLPVNEAVPLQPSATVVCWSAHVLLSSVSMPGLDLPNGVHDDLAKLSRSTVYPFVDHLQSDGHDMVDGATVLDHLLKDIPKLTGSHVE
jgi:hypothetical protein